MREIANASIGMIIILSSYAFGLAVLAKKLLTSFPRLKGRLGEANVIFWIRHGPNERGHVFTFHTSLLSI